MTDPLCRCEWRRERHLPGQCDRCMPADEWWARANRFLVERRARLDAARSAAAAPGQGLPVSQTKESVAEGATDVQVQSEGTR